MKLPACIAIVAVLTLGGVLAHPAFAQVEVNAPNTSPRAMVRSAPSPTRPPAAEIGALMTLAQAQTQTSVQTPPAFAASSAQARAEAGSSARGESDRAPRRRGF